MKVSFLVAMSALFLILSIPRASAQSALPGAAGSESPLSFLSDWNEAINRFFTEGLKQFFFHYFNRAKDILVSVFWGVVNFVKSVVGYVKNAGSVVW